MLNQEVTALLNNLFFYIDFSIIKEFNKDDNKDDNSFQRLKALNYQKVLNRAAINLMVNLRIA